MTTKKSSITIHDNKNLEKQMGGCMAGFFNLFDISSKRDYPKRLPPPVVDSLSSDTEIQKPRLQPVEKQSVVQDKNVAKPSPNLENPVTVSPWKFTRETPRLSLDSRAITDAKGGLRPREIRINTASNTGNFADDEDRKSPSVIARLMGLEPLLPSSTVSTCSGFSEQVKTVELRRSASESRSRDDRDYRFADRSSFLSPEKKTVAGERKLDNSIVNNRNSAIDNRVSGNNNAKSNNGNPKKLGLEKRSYYDSTDFFPQSVTIYGEIEKRLRIKGIDEQSKDLETLKHIIEALQLKGLLHSTSTSKFATKANTTRRNVVFKESSIVSMKPGRIRTTSPINRQRNYNNSSGDLSVSPRKDRLVKSHNRVDNRSLSPTVRRKDETTGTRTGTRSDNSPVQSPRLIRRSDEKLSRSPRNRRLTVQHSGPAYDEVSTVSECSLSTSSQTENERCKIEEYRDGRNLLKRCDKLLNSIAEITASSSSNSNSNSNSNSSELQQPSPVSVLDSSFYKEDESSPSPVKKRSIDFKDQGRTEFEDESSWSLSSLSTQLLKLDYDIDFSDDSEFSYVSEVIRAFDYFPYDDNLFLLLEKRSSIRGVSRDNSKASILQRKLIYDTIIEILDRHRRVPPWKAASIPVTKSLSERTWSELQKIREPAASEDLLEVVCQALQKDMAGDSTTGWGDHPTEMSDAILDIERLVFKDLIGEIIRDLATNGRKNVGVEAFRRKLVF